MTICLIKYGETLLLSFYIFKRRKLSFLIGTFKIKFLFGFQNILVSRLLHKKPED